MEDYTLTEENQYDFMIWCVDQIPKSIEKETFIELMRARLPNHLFDRWEYIKGALIDAMTQQKKLEKKNKEERMKPTDPVKRRELLASICENRFKNRFVSIKPKKKFT